jgi:hypothetical protein
MLDEGSVGDALVKRLAKAGATALVLPVGISTDDLSAQLDTWLADGPIAGVYWLPALDDEGSHGDLDLEFWTECLRRRVKRLYTTMRRMWDDAPVPGVGHSIGRSPWLRRPRRRRPHGRRRDRLHQVLQEGAPGHPRQGRRLPGQP